MKSVCSRCLSVVSIVLAIVFPAAGCESAAVCGDSGMCEMDGGGGQERDWEGEYADTVVAAPGVDPDVSDPELAVNGVRGCGEGCGSSDVAQLSLEPPEDAYIILSWSGRRVTNGPGADFVVFENPFRISGSTSVFMEQMVVFLSRNGVDWVPFPHDYTAPNETVYSNNPEHWRGFAGVNPVMFHEENNPVDPFDPDSAGGDHFDLSDLPEDGGEAQAIREEGFVYLKLVCAPTLINPDTGENFVKDPVSNGGDVDGVYARHLEPLD